MDQSEQLHQMKATIQQYPHFMRELLKKPLFRVDFEIPLNLITMLIYTFLTGAAVGFLLTIFTLHFSGIFSVLIFMPFQLILGIGVLAFVIQFILEKINMAHISFLQVFKLLATIVMITTVYALPFLILASFIKMAEINLGIAVAVLVGQAYLSYRGLVKQFRVPGNKASGIVAVFLILFLIPIVSNFTNGFHARAEARQARKTHDQLMEKSIEEIEKDLNQKND